MMMSGDSGGASLELGTAGQARGGHPVGRPAGRRLVLASTSPYRRELLARLQLEFETAPPQVDEAPRTGEKPAQTALRLAQEKAAAVAHRYPDAVIIGSDQVADCDGELVGKPGTMERARAMLLRLSGRTVVFHTGLAVLDARSRQCQSALVDVRSTFRQLEAAEIDAYLAREAALDCAGAVKVETLGIALFRSVEADDPTALIGLPLIRLIDMLHAVGIRPLG
ncbi:MAG: Maf family nucleotide pyrophosphatase [Pseudomonadota bacterium]|nr:Maf family nucleotide pyrophosphatase [Pseudomonadota bacterium]